MQVIHLRDLAGTLAVSHYQVHHTLADGVIGGPSLTEWILLRSLVKVPCVSLGVRGEPREFGHASVDDLGRRYDGFASVRPCSCLCPCFFVVVVFVLKW